MTDYRFKEAYLSENFKELQLVSEMASRYNVEDVEVIELFDCCSSVEEVFNELSFHPNGRCGCILSKDEYIFGIRCNHLMWSEGTCEGGEKFWNECDEKTARRFYEKYDEDEIISALDRNYECIFVFGNHKGSFVGNLIVLHKPDRK